jgi:hypothetical protein
MNDGLKLIIGIILIVALVGFNESLKEKASQRVLDELTNRGFQEIEVSRLWKAGRVGLFFAVKYIDHQGNKCENTCVVIFGFISVNKIYWEKPLEPVRTFDKSSGM